MKRILFCLAALLASAPAMADEAATVNTETAGPQVKTEQQFEEIVVTATRGEKELDAAPGQVAVVKRQDIARRNVKNLDESVKHVAGVYNRRSKGPADTLAAITLHGIPDQKRTLLLMDGVVLNNAYYGGAKMGGYSAEDIERVEVVQGPASSLYGGYAMGGVVSFITRMPEEREFTAKVTRGEAYRDGEANDDYKRYYLSYGDRYFDKLSFFIGMDRSATEGYPSELNVQSKAPTAGINGYYLTTSNYGAMPRYILGDRGNNQWWEHSLTSRVQYEFSDDTRLRLGYTRSRYEYDYGLPHTWLRDASGNLVYGYGSGAGRVLPNSFNNGNGAKDGELYSLNFDTAVDDVKVKLVMGVNRELTNWYITPGTTAATSMIDGPGTLSDSLNNNFTTDLQLSLPVGVSQILTVGGSFKYDQSKSTEHSLPNWTNEKGKGAINYTAEGKDVLYGLFVQDEIDFSDKLTMYAGLRADWWKVYDGEVQQAGSSDYPKLYASRREAAYSPKLALVYRPLEQTTLKFSAGKAFRAPTIYDLYRTWTSSTGKTTFGYAGLKPETVNSLDLSVKQGLWQGADIEVGYFENYLSNLIYTVNLPNNEAQRTNVGKAQTKGFVLQANQQVDDWLKLYANTTVLTQSKITRNFAKPESRGEHLTQQPMRIANAGIEAEYGGLSAGLNWRYVSKRYGDDQNRDRAADDIYTIYGAYSVADVKVAYEFRENATIAVAIDNVFDRQYCDYYRAPGRTSYVEVGFKF